MSRTPSVDPHLCAAMFNTLVNKDLPDGATDNPFWSFPTRIVELNDAQRNMLDMVAQHLGVRDDDLFLALLAESKTAIDEPYVLDASTRTLEVQTYHPLTGEPCKRVFDLSPAMPSGSCLYLSTPGVPDDMVSALVTHSLKDVVSRPSFMRTFIEKTKGRTFTGDNIGGNEGNKVCEGPIVEGGLLPEYTFNFEKVFCSGRRSGKTSVMTETLNQMLADTVVVGGTRRDHLMATQPMEPDYNPCRDVVVQYTEFDSVRKHLMMWQDAIKQPMKTARELLEDEVNAAFRNCFLTSADQLPKDYLGTFDVAVVKEPVQPDAALQEFQLTYTQTHGEQNYTAFQTMIDSWLAGIRQGRAIPQQRVEVESVTSGPNPHEVTVNLKIHPPVPRTMFVIDSIPRGLLDDPPNPSEPGFIVKPVEGVNSARFSQGFEPWEIKAEDVKRGELGAFEGFRFEDIRKSDLFNKAGTPTADEFRRMVQEMKTKNVPEDQRTLYVGGDFCVEGFTYHRSLMSAKVYAHAKGADMEDLDGNTMKTMAAYDDDIHRKPSRPVSIPVSVTRNGSPAVSVNPSGEIDLPREKPPSKAFTLEEQETFDLGFNMLLAQCEADGEDKGTTMVRLEQGMVDFAPKDAKLGKPFFAKVSNSFGIIMDRPDDSVWCGFQQHAVSITRKPWWTN